MKESKKGLRPAKSADSSPSGGRAESEAGEQSTTSKGRRKFLGQLAGTAAAAAVSDLALSRKAQAGQKVAAAPNGTYAPLSESELMARRAVSFNGRLKHAAVWRDAAFELQLANDDELIYPEKFANCSRMLPHDGLGHPDLNAWDAFVTACHSGKPADFEAVPLGGTRPLRNPLSGMCFELCGYDSNQSIVAPAPAFASAWRAGEAVEVYWAALLRDIPFADWATDPLVAQACADLSALSDYRGPKEAGLVTPNTIFRSPYPGGTRGPWLSQFQLRDIQYGAQLIVQKLQAFMPGSDYLADYAEWLSIQNGGSFGPRAYDPVRRYLRDLRGTATWVDADPPAQAAEYALAILLGLGTPFDAANPYFNGQITTSDAFVTFGPVEWFDMARVCRPAHETVWFQKWRIHRTLRPEEYGGRVHNHLTGAFNYPLHPDVLNSAAIAETFSKQGTYLCSQAYPEGAPTHTSYPSGHSTNVGATATMLKALFDLAVDLPHTVAGLISHPNEPALVDGEARRLGADAHEADRPVRTRVDLIDRVVEAVCHPYAPERGRDGGGAAPGWDRLNDAIPMRVDGRDGVPRPARHPDRGGLATDRDAARVRPNRDRLSDFVRLRVDPDERGIACVRHPDGACSIGECRWTVPDVDRVDPLVSHGIDSPDGAVEVVRDPYGIGAHDDGARRLADRNRVDRLMRLGVDLREGVTSAVGDPNGTLTVGDGGWVDASGLDGRAELSARRIDHSDGIGGDCPDPCLAGTAGEREDRDCDRCRDHAGENAPEERAPAVEAPSGDGLLGRLGQLALAAGESGLGLCRPERWKLAREALDVQLVEPLGTIEILQVLLA